jgi:hypothetical protein
MSVVSLPEANILSFSASCGSGEKGARPSQRYNTISSDQDTRRRCAHENHYSIADLKRGGVILTI